MMSYKKYDSLREGPYSGKTMVWLDPDYNVISPLIKFLREDGLKILATGDPEVAEKLINEEHAEYFLSELLLPEMETPETLSYILRLGRQHPGMKVGVLSNVDLAPYEIPFNMLSLRKVSLLPSDLESAINEYWLP